MPRNAPAYLVYATAPDADVAGEIAERLVRDGLAACVNVLPGMIAHFKWDGKTQRATEAAMIMKISGDQIDTARAVFVDLHPYDTPAFAAVAIDEGASFEPFLHWLAASGAASD